MLQKSCQTLLFRRYLSNSVHVAAVKQGNKGNREPLITCKRPEFNSYVGDKVSVNAKSVPLASSAWKNRKSKGDFFILHPHSVQINEEIYPDYQPWGSDFKDLGLNETLIQNLATGGLARTTWVQDKVIPLVLGNQHVLVAAETGCGKTLAYLLPLIDRIMRTKERIGTREFNSPLLLIVTPGRELAEQIEVVARQMCEGTNLTVKSILGGNTRQLMTQPTFEDFDILIGTIGAVSKLTTTGILRVNECRHVVLDEADTLLDDSFGEKMQHFMKRFPVG